ncbi:MAG: 30S ribosomal protein S6 [Planctomycetota bacterium]|nr:30S ribosomal protein S6 [Planctomycetota bacterium]
MSSATQTTRLYEAMFLVDSNKANQDYEKVTSAIHNIITRHGGDIANSELWDNERKLAFQIGNYSKGTYVLVHFNAEPSRIEGIRHEYELFDQVIRVMILVDEDGISSEIRSLSDDPTDPVRSRSKSRDVNVPTSSPSSSRGSARSFDAASNEDDSESDRSAGADSESEESNDEENAPAEEDETSDVDAADEEGAEDEPAKES